MPGFRSTNSAVLASRDQFEEPFKQLFEPGNLFGTVNCKPGPRHQSGVIPQGPEQRAVIRAVRPVPPCTQAPDPFIIRVGLLKPAEFIPAESKEWCRESPHSSRFIHWIGNRLKDIMNRLSFGRA